MTSFNLDAKSRAALDVGRMRGWPIPPAAQAATDLYAAAAAVASAPEPPAPTPMNPLPRHHHKKPTPESLCRVGCYVVREENGIDGFCGY
jgi:hypothetical protein